MFVQDSFASLKIHAGFHLLFILQLAHSFDPPSHLLVGHEMHLLKTKKLSRIVLSLKEPEALLFLEG